MPLKFTYSSSESHVLSPHPQLSLRALSPSPPVSAEVKSYLVVVRLWWMCDNQKHPCLHAWFPGFIAVGWSPVRLTHSLRESSSLCHPQVLGSSSPPTPLTPTFFLHPDPAHGPRHTQPVMVQVRTFTYMYLCSLKNQHTAR